MKVSSRLLECSAPQPTVCEQPYTGPRMSCCSWSCECLPHLHSVAWHLNWENNEESKSVIRMKRVRLQHRCDLWVSLSWLPCHWIFQRNPG